MKHKRRGQQWTWTQARLATGLAVLACLVLWRCGSAYSDLDLLFKERGADEWTYMSRFKEVRRDLPERGTIGYIGDPSLNQVDYHYAHVLTAFALCPLRVECDSKDHDFVLANLNDRLSVIDMRKLPEKPR